MVDTDMTFEEYMANKMEHLVGTRDLEEAQRREQMLVDYPYE